MTQIRAKWVFIRRSAKRFLMRGSGTTSNIKSDHILEKFEFLKFFSMDGSAGIDILKYMAVLLISHFYF